MKLNSSDVLRLYGKKLFILEGWEKPTPTAEPEKIEKDNPVEIPKELDEKPAIQEKAEPAPVVAEKKEEETVSEQIEEPVVETSPVTPVEEEVAAPDLSCFAAGEAVIWKMRPSSQFALILQKSEFSNRELTGLLKASIVKAGIDPSLVGFGVIEDACQACNLEEMTVSFALICHKLGDNLSSPVDVSGKKLWLVPALAELPAQPEKQEELDAAMAALAQML